MTYLAIVLYLCGAIDAWFTYGATGRARNISYYTNIIGWPINVIFLVIEAIYITYRREE